MTSQLSGNEPVDPAQSAGVFPLTAWTLVQRALDAGPDERQAALNELLRCYWRPIYGYLRRTGRPVEQAEDLTQAFFVHLLEKHLLERVRLRQVRFRGYLRSVLEHFLANEARTAKAQKRTAGVLLNLAQVEDWLVGRSQEEPSATFDGIWALELLETAVTRLRAELRRGAREWLAEVLVQRTGLGDVAAPVSLQALAAQHGVNENQLSVALHRARGRLRELILEEIRNSVTSPEEVTAELNELFRVLGERRPG